jgi:hypothetical protein
MEPCRGFRKLPLQISDDRTTSLSYYPTVFNGG